MKRGKKGLSMKKRDADFLKVFFPHVSVINKGIKKVLSFQKLLFFFFPLLRASIINKEENATSNLRLPNLPYSINVCISI